MSDEASPQPSANRFNVLNHQNVPLHEYQTNLRAICGYFKVVISSVAVWACCVMLDSSLTCPLLGSSIAGAMALHCDHTHHSATSL